MKLLIINTSQPESVVALVDDRTVHASRRWQSTPALGEALLGAIDEMLHEVAWQLSDLDRIAVHLGPGGSSALRQGAMTAAMLAQTTDTELVGIVGAELDQLIEAAMLAQPQQVIQPDYSRKTTAS